MPCHHGDNIPAMPTFEVGSLFGYFAVLRQMQHQGKNVAMSANMGSLI
jgi:hypothetical protein